MWWRVTRFLWTLIAVELGVIAACAANLQAQKHTVTLHGKLFRAPDVECGFFLDPLADSEGIQLFQVLEGNYLCEWLRGTDGREVTIQITPEAK